MNRRRVRLAVVALLGLAWALGGEWVSIHARVPENHLLDLLSGIGFLVVGVVVADQRPGNRVGPLLLAFVAVYFAGNWANLHVPGLSVLLVLVASLVSALLAHIALAYPGGRLGTRYELAVVVAVYAMNLGTTTGTVLTFDPRSAGCVGCGWAPVVWPDLAVARAFDRLNNVSAVALVPMFLVALWLRWRRSTPAGRRDLTALWVAVVIIALAYLPGAFARGARPGSFGYLLGEVQALLRIALPLVLLAGLLSTRLARGAVGPLLLELRGPVPPGELRGLLARTLGDPGVRIVYALDGTGRWVDADGRPAPDPADASGPPGRQRPPNEVTVVERDGRRLAALLHDPALDRDLVRAAAAAAGMAIENEWLHAELRARLAEVRASRARLVRASDEERRRVERDLHDGAQQRLLSLALALHAARRQAAAGAAAELTGTLTRAADELRAALEELRELARGIHPAILTDAGLGPALRSLADRSAVPVTLAEVPGVRFGRTVEATVYFLVSEALANAARHAPAARARVAVRLDGGRLAVTVADDGPGGADPSGGTGLRGLADRVAALGGTLSVHSPPAGGTVVRADLPVPGRDDRPLDGADLPVPVPRPGRGDAAAPGPAADPIDPADPAGTGREVPA